MDIFTPKLNLYTKSENRSHNLHLFLMNLLEIAFNKI